MSDGNQATARSYRREEFELAGSAGRTIRGEAILVENALATVVLVHGFKGCYRFAFFPWLAERLATAGMNVVGFNFTGSGIGEDRETVTDPAAFEDNSYGRELYDLQHVLRECDARAWLGPRFGLFGHSRGGGIAILHAARDERVASLVTWASIARVHRWSEAEVTAWRASGRHEVINSRTGQVFQLGTQVLEEAERHRADRLNIARAAASLVCPWLIVHGESDETVPIAEGEILAELAGEQASLLRVAGATHGFCVSHGMTEVSPELQIAGDHTVEHFTTTLGA